MSAANGSGARAGIVDNRRGERRGPYSCPGCGSSDHARGELDYGGFPIVRCVNPDVPVSKRHPVRGGICGVLDSRRADRRTGVPWASVVLAPRGYRRVVAIVAAHPKETALAAAQGVVLGLGFTLQLGTPIVVGLLAGVALTYAIATR